MCNVCKTTWKNEVLFILLHIFKNEDISKGIFRDGVTKKFISEVTCSSLADLNFITIF